MTVLLPESVREGFHPVFRDGVGCRAGHTEPAHHTGCVDHPSFGFLDEWQEPPGDVDQTVQVHTEHVVVIFFVKPFNGSYSSGDPSVVEHRPQAWRDNNNIGLPYLNNIDMFPIGCLISCYSLQYQPLSASHFLSLPEPVGRLFLTNS